jgi:hypothetical protein
MARLDIHQIIHRREMIMTRLRSKRSLGQAGPEDNLNGLRKFAEQVLPHL